MTNLSLAYVNHAVSILVHVNLPNVNNLANIKVSYTVHRVFS